MAAKIYLLKTERAEQFHGRLIEFRGLNFHNAEILFLQVTQDVHQQELSQSLSPKVLADLKGEYAGGRRAPVRSVLLVFVFSGVFHEAAFALATSRLTGYQFAFFAIQGPAALASRQLERLARRGGIAGRMTAHGVTILFLCVTSVLFFHGISKVFPSVLLNGSPLP